MKFETTTKIMKKVFSRAGFYWSGNYVKVNTQKGRIENLDPSNNGFFHFDDISDLEILERSNKPIYIENPQNNATLSNIYELCISSDRECDFDKPIYIMLNHNNYNCDITYVSYKDKNDKNKYTCGFYAKDLNKSNKIKPIKEEIFEKLQLDEQKLTYAFNDEMFKEYGFEYILEASKIYLQETINNAVLNKDFNETKLTVEDYDYHVPYENTINPWFIKKAKNLRMQVQNGDASLEDSKIYNFLEKLIANTCVKENAFEEEKPDFDKIQNAVDMLKYYCHADLHESLEFEKSPITNLFYAKTTQQNQNNDFTK